MPWLCPTLKRPERLAELAVSWVRHSPETELLVRVWKDDPKKDEYFSIEWPETWQLFESDKLGAGETLQEMWLMRPDAPFYGFIGDDIVLRTPAGLERLEAMAGDWFIAYPNDTLQRHRLCTHFCVGGRLTNVLGWLVPGGIQHGYMDVPLMNIGLNTGLLRYCPDVIFQHKHFLVEYSKFDEVYAEMYDEGGQLRESERVLDDRKRLEEYYAKHFKDDIVKVLKAVILNFEDPEQWDREDYEALGHAEEADVA